MRHIIDRKRTIEAEKRIKKHRVRLIREIAYVVFAMAMVSMSLLPAVLDAVESRNTKTLAAGSEITGEMREEMDGRQIMLAVYDEIPGKLRDEIWSELDEHEREAVVLTIAEIEKHSLNSIYYTI